MRKCGIICEYDPFHNGHKYHLEKIKQATGADIVCVMSGDFTQRALPALFDKWLRSEAALKCGADVVIELPVVYSTAPAEVFAFGAIKILSQIEGLKYFSCGVETDDTDALKKIANLQSDEPPKMREYLRALLKQGLSYPNCLAEATAAFLSDLSDKNSAFKYDKEYILGILSSPNNVLAIEYLKAVARLRLDVEPIFIRRTDAGYKSKELIPPYASATAIRVILQSDADYSAFVPFDYGKPKLDVGLYESVLRLSLLQKHILFAEGMEKKLKKAAEKYADLSQIIEAVKSKRYTYSRINRLIFSTMLDIDGKFLKYSGDFLFRVLGIRPSFKSNLSDLGKNAVIKLTDKPYINQTGEDIFIIDKKASDLYAVITHSSSTRFCNRLRII